MQLKEYKIIINTDCYVLFNSTVHSFSYDGNTYYRHKVVDGWGMSIKWHTNIHREQTLFNYLSSIGWYARNSWDLKPCMRPDIEKEFKKELCK